MLSKIISSDSFAILLFASKLNAFSISLLFNSLLSNPRLSKFVIVPQSTEATKFGEILLSLQMDSNKTR